MCNKPRGVEIKKPTLGNNMRIRKRHIVYRGRKQQDDGPGIGCIAWTVDMSWESQPSRYCMTASSFIPMLHRTWPKWAQRPNVIDRISQRKIHCSQQAVAASNGWVGREHRKTERSGCDYACPGAYSSCRLSQTLQHLRKDSARIYKKASLSTITSTATAALPSVHPMKFTNKYGEVLGLPIARRCTQV